MTTLVLKKPVESFGKSVAEITFRELKGGDLIPCGSPFMLVQRDDEDGDGVLPMPGAIAKYITRLTGLTPGAVKDMSAPDFMEATQIVIGFFGEEPSGSAPRDGSISPTKSPASGASVQPKPKNGHSANS